MSESTNPENPERLVEEVHNEVLAEIDPRCESVKGELVQLLEAAQGIWKDALQSQVRLTVKADLLQESLNQIREYSALPSYPHGLKQIQDSIRRIGICKKRIDTITNRLSRLNGLLNQAPKK